MLPAFAKINILIEHPANLVDTTICNIQAPTWTSCWVTVDVSSLLQSVLCWFLKSPTGVRLHVKSWIVSNKGNWIMDIEIHMPPLCVLCNGELQQIKIKIDEIYAMSHLDRWTQMSEPKWVLAVLANKNNYDKTKTNRRRSRYIKSILHCKIPYSIFVLSYYIYVYLFCSYGLIHVESIIALEGLCVSSSRFKKKIVISFIKVYQNS